MAFNSDNTAASMETTNSFSLHTCDGAFVHYRPNIHPTDLHDALSDFAWETFSDCMSDYESVLSESLSGGFEDAASGSSDSTRRSKSSLSNNRIVNASAFNVLHAALNLEGTSESATENLERDNSCNSDISQCTVTSLDRLPVEILYQILCHLNRSSLQQLFQAYIENPRMCKLISKYISSKRPSEVCFLEIIGQATVAPFLKPEYILNIGQSMQVYEVFLFPKSQLIFHSGSPVQFGLPEDKTYCCPLYSSTACSRTSIFCLDTHKTLLYVLSVMIDQRRLPSFILRNIKLSEGLVAVFEQWHLENRVSVDMMKMCDLDLSGYSKSLSYLVECFSPIWFFFRDPKIYDPLLLNKVFDKTFFKGHALRRCKDVHITDLKYTPHLALSTPLKKYILKGSWQTLHITYQIQIKQEIILRLLKECISGRKNFVKFSIVTKKIYSSIQYTIRKKILTDKWKGEVLKREPNYIIFKLYDRNTEDFHVKIHYCYFVISRKPVPLTD